MSKNEGEREWERSARERDVEEKEERWKEGGWEKTKLKKEEDLLIYYNREMKISPCPMERMLSSTVDVSSVIITFINLIFNMYQVLNCYKSC